MSALATAVDAYLQAMQRAQTTDDIQAAVLPLQAQVQIAPPQELTQALSRLLGAMQQSPLPIISTTSLICGAMVEHGGDPQVCGPFLLDCLGKMLSELRQYWEQVHALSKTTVTPENAAQLGAQHIGSILQSHPGLAWAFYFQRPFVMGVIAHLSKSKALRAAARKRPELLADAPNIDILSHDDPTYLACMLRVLDDEPLVVLHPGERKGFEVRLTAVADVLQLDTLMAANLIGNPAEGWLTGTRPSEDIISAVTDGPVRFDLNVDGVFNLWRWGGLRPDGTLPTVLTPSESVLPWHAFPDDIPKYEGTRVLLIGPRFPAANWPGTRRYRDMPGSLTVERILTPNAVRDWLKRLAAAPRLVGPA